MATFLACFAVADIIFIFLMMSVFVIMVPVAMVVVMIVAVMMIMAVIVIPVIVAFTTAVIVVMIVAVMVMIVTLSVGVVVMIAIAVIVIVVVMRIVKVIVQARFLKQIDHDMFQFMRIHIQNGGHETEIYPFARFQYAVMFDAAFHIRQIKGHSGTVVLVNGGFDMAKKRTRFLLHPFSRSQKSFCKPRLGIRVVSVNMSFQTYGDTSRFFHGGLLRIGVLFFAVMTVAVISVLMMVVVGGHCIIS